MHSVNPSVQELYVTPEVTQLRNDLALALRAAHYHDLAEGVCNHFSILLAGQSDLFLLNPQGLMWSEITGDDIVLVDSDGNPVAGAHEIEPTAMFIHAAIHRITTKRCVLHTHMPYATALSLTQSGMLDTRLSQNAMRFHNRVVVDSAYNGFALNHSEGERIAHTINDADIAFLGNHGVVVCNDRIDYAYDDLYYLERACSAEILARSTGLPLRRASNEMALKVARQVNEERLQSELFFKALARIL